MVYTMDRKQALILDNLRLIDGTGALFAQPSAHKKLVESPSTPGIADAKFSTSGHVIAIATAEYKIMTMK